MLDKKALRKFDADHPAPAIPPGHGLLRAPQVDYIIRTAVRTIARRRTLALYVYDRKQAVSGNPAPTWTMFQAGADYITLARREDGSTCWRQAAFKHLDRRYGFTEKCAFYSARDEARVCDFLHDGGHGGMAALVRAQQAVLDRRTRERRLRREKDTVRRMRPLRALPRGLSGWVRREIMPAYFRCAHTSAKRPVTGVCTSCGKEFTLPGAAHNAKTICPHCGRELTVKSMGKMGRHHDRATVQAIEKTSGDEIVVRIVKAWYGYGRDSPMPTRKIYENARIFVRRGPDGGVSAEPYYYAYGKGTLTHWMPGERPTCFKYCYNFEADSCGHVYSKNLPEALAGTPWEYCPLAAFYGHFREPMEMLPFLRAYLEHPRLEHLVKIGFFNLACDLAYRGDYGHVLDESQRRTHRILKIAPEDVPFLRELDVTMETLNAYQGYAGLKDRQRLLRWQLDNDVTRDVDHLLESMTPHKLMRYMDVQHALPGPDGKGRHGGMQQAVSEYRDYLDMCAQLGYDTSNDFVLYPKDLREAHDLATGRLKAEADARLRHAFEAAMEAAAERMAFEAGDIRVVLPASPDDLIAEGHELRHCVGGYADRVARRECVILFIRRAEEPDKPFYTMEIRNGKVVQVRGRGNHAPTPEVEKFLAQWERQVLRAA